MRFVFVLFDESIQKQRKKKERKEREREKRREESCDQSYFIDYDTQDFNTKITTFNQKIELDDCNTQQSSKC